MFRAAYGLYYSAPQWDITRNLAANPPEFVVSSFANDQFDFLNARSAGGGIRPPATRIGAGYSCAQSTSMRARPTRSNGTPRFSSNCQRAVADGRVCRNQGTKLQGYPNINQPVPGTGALAARRPFPRFDNISAIQNRFDSSYHGLQVTAERRFSSGLAFQFAYTYSHAIDVTSQFGGVMDIRNIALDRGNSENDVRHRAVASWTYAVPFRASGVMRQIVEGWQVNGILSLYGGLPFTVNSSNNTLNIGSGTRADRIGEGSLPDGQRTVERWFDTEAFATPGLQIFGNAGRNILRGPGTKQLDFRFSKPFRSALTAGAASSFEPRRST